MPSPMQRVTQIAVTVTIAGICCAVATTFCAYNYARYQANTDTEERFRSLEIQ